MTSVIRIIVFLLVSLTMATALPAAAQGGCPSLPPDPNDDPYSSRPGEHPVATDLRPPTASGPLPQPYIDISRGRFADGTVVKELPYDAQGDVITIERPDGTQIKIDPRGFANVSLPDGTDIRAGEGTVLNGPAGLHIAVSVSGGLIALPSGFTVSWDIQSTSSPLLGFIDPLGSRAVTISLSVTDGSVRVDHVSQGEVVTAQGGFVRLLPPGCP